MSWQCAGGEPAARSVMQIHTYLNLVLQEFLAEWHDAMP